MDQPVLDSRRYQEKNMQSEIQRQTATGALYQLIFNALMQPQRHQRAAIIKLCKQQGYTTENTVTALNVMQLADWIKTKTDDLEVLVYLTEFAKLTGVAKV